jgi:hypothetical protein
MTVRSSSRIAVWLAVFCAVTWWATSFLAVDGCLGAGGMVISQFTCEGDGETSWNMFEKLKPLALIVAAVAGAAVASTASWILARLFKRWSVNAT